MTDEMKIIGTALVTALVTIGFTEPLRACFQRRHIRRWLYREIIYNCDVLEAWVHSAKDQPEMQEHTTAQFASQYRKLAFELAVRDAGFYSLRGEEPYFIDGLYRDFERISAGAFHDPKDCLLKAQVASAAVLHGVQDRMLSRRVVFNVSTRRQRAHLRSKLPHHFLYINRDDAPHWLERLRFRSDAVLFWLWRKRASLMQSQKR
ncbi:MAG TPA: hypothetical protein VIY49_17980 [Bryobacteraceae bacterium]